MRLMMGDCLERMADIEDGSVDLVLTDPPYGTTACKWDAVIPFEPMWAQVWQLLKPNGAAVFTASQPFTSALVMSQVDRFKYSWIWRKTKPSGFMQAKSAPLRVTEDVLVFSHASIGATAKDKLVYYPQGIRSCNESYDYDGTGVLGRRKSRTYSQTSTCYPYNVLEISSESTHAHPTQKPVALMEYLIRTYTNEGETVLDFTMGSGTTGVACANTNRQFIGIERDPTYFQIAQDRIAEAQRKLI